MGSYDSYAEQYNGMVNSGGGGQGVPTDLFENN